MRELWSELPIVRAARALAKRRDRGAIVLCVLLAVYALVSLATPWSRPLQRALIEAHHMRPSSMLVWIALQPAPKMYGFAHRVWLGGVPLANTARSRARFTAEQFWMNHYPARRARFDGARGFDLGRHPGARYLYLETSYRGLTVKSGYEMKLVDERLRIRRIEAP